MSVSFEPVTRDSLEYIADNVRDADRLEVMYSHGVDPLTAIVGASGESSLSSVAMCDGVPVAVFGMVKLGGLFEYGSPWLIGTDQLFTLKREFLTYTRQGVDQMLRMCPSLINYVHCENVKSIRWLKSMGFEFDDPAPYGVAGEPFNRFHMTRT